MNQIKEPNELEQKKLSLVKALEELQKEIDYRNIDRLWDHREEFRKLINDRDRVINELNNAGFNVYPSGANFIYLYLDSKLTPISWILI